MVDTKGTFGTKEKHKNFVGYNSIGKFPMVHFGAKEYEIKNPLELLCDELFHRNFGGKQI
jgi:hypothetical protein